MRYTAFLLLGLLLIVAQGEVYLLTGPLAAIHPQGWWGWLLSGLRPSLLVPLVVWLGVTETNLALGAGVAFLLGYVLDVLGGSPVGLHAFTSVATIALARVAGLRIVTQGGYARALLAGGFAALADLLALVLMAIFGRPYAPRAMLPQIIPHALATALVAPLVFRLAARTNAIAAGFMGRSESEPRRAIDTKVEPPATKIDTPSAEKLS